MKAVKRPRAGGVSTGSHGTGGADDLGTAARRGVGHRSVDLKCECPVGMTNPSARAADVALRFGVPLAASRVTIVGSARVEIGPGRIVLLVGPSGSGKSSALGRVARRFPACSSVGQAPFPSDRAVVDVVAPAGTLASALSMMTACGLGEPRLWLRSFDTLSDGERFRASLARAVAAATRSRSSAPLLCDEFCSLLHRRVAKAISFNIRKIVSRRRLCLVVASSNEDVIADLQPDEVVWLRGGGACEVQVCSVRLTKPFSLRRRLRIERGGKRDYDTFAAMHYRDTDELGFVDKVFVMREGSGGELLGIVVYSHGPLELALRNRATDGWFSRNPGRVNRSLRILRRLVVHPDVRGCGLGHHLVRKTLPLVGTEYVECLATMGAFNPVFEKAGMQRVGQYDVSPKRQAALDALLDMGVDPSAGEFVAQVCRRRRVREIVARVVFDWYAATTASGELRVARQSPEFLAQTFRGLIASRPVYYLWRKSKRKAA